MPTFGPISSLFDFLTFGLMLGVLHARPPQFRTGWFVESLATQTLIIFAIRTRRIPFFRSRPGGVLMAATLSVIAIGVALTISPRRHAVAAGSAPSYEPTPPTPPWKGSLPAPPLPPAPPGLPMNENAPALPPPTASAMMSRSPLSSHECLECRCLRRFTQT